MRTKLVLMLAAIALAAAPSARAVDCGHLPTIEEARAQAAINVPKSLRELAGHGGLALAFDETTAKDPVLSKVATAGAQVNWLRSKLETLAMDLKPYLQTDGYHVAQTDPEAVQRIQTQAAGVRAQLKAAEAELERVLAEVMPGEIESMARFNVEYARRQCDEAKKKEYDAAISQKLDEESKRLLGITPAQ